MKIRESITKTFALFRENDDQESDVKVRVVADPRFHTIKIVGGVGSATLYTREAEGVANMILMAEQFNREQGGDDESA